MPDLYFTCDWIIRPAVNYVRLVDVARDLGCELALVKAHIVTPDKLVLTCFVLRASSQAAFDEFVEKVGQSVGLTDWLATTADDFGRAQVLDLQLLDAAFIAKWMDGMHAYGIHNQHVQQEQDTSS